MFFFVTLLQYMLPQHSLQALVTQNRTAWQQKTEVQFVPSWTVDAAASEEALDYLQSAAGCQEVLVEVWLEGSFDSPGASPADDLAAAQIVYCLVNSVMLHMIKKFFTY